MTTILFCSSCIALLLLIVFRTEAFIEYCRLFHLNGISFYKDFDAKRKDDASLTYIKYLRQYHNNFFIRLITCPICLSVWVGIILSILFIHFYMLPINVIFGLLLFAAIDRLLG